MSKDNTPPPPGPRKPRFFRPDETALDSAIKTDSSPSPSRLDKQSGGIAAPDKGKQQPHRQERPADRKKAKTKKTKKTGKTEKDNKNARLHMPAERPSGTSGDKTDKTRGAAHRPEAMQEDQDRTIPTLKDIRAGFRWTGLLLGAAGALAALAFTAWLHSHIAGLLARQDWIGWLALALVMLVCFALAMIALRELLALRLLAKIGHLRELAERAIRHDDRRSAEKIQRNIISLFRGRHSLSWGLAELQEHQKEVLSARDRLVLVERNLMVALDQEARRIVAESARRVSVMTAISPFVFLDMLLVGVENFRMLRRLMSLYGGRPGLFSQFRLIKLMIANLAMSGGLAVGADLVGHVMGRQVATRLAGRIGEGLINGSLTARLGITATGLIRPLPYLEAKPTTITAFVKELTRGSGKQAGGNTPDTRPRK